jgi:hypothetical protein
MVHFSPTLVNIGHWYCAVVTPQGLAKKFKIGCKTIEHGPAKWHFANKLNYLFSKIALDACRLIANGNQASLTLTNDDRLTNLRALETLSPANIKLDLMRFQIFRSRMDLEV